ncbi:unnamed protein product, partial [Urochloa humidicola]
VRRSYLAILVVPPHAATGWLVTSVRRPGGWRRAGRHPSVVVPFCGCHRFSEEAHIQLDPKESCVMNANFHS